MLKKIKRMITRSDLTKVHVSDDLPIAELYPNTTVMFADIAGFTAWSSEREPAQVFQLLETIYHTFDIIAQRLAVFKVETIGDCCKYKILNRLDIFQRIISDKVRCRRRCCHWVTGA